MYGAVPPVAVTVAEPPVEQLALVWLVMEALGPPVGPWTVTEAVAEQPPASVTVTVWFPAERLVAVWVVWLLSHL